MLQLQALRQDPEKVKAKLAVKHFAEGQLVDQIIEMDDRRKQLQLEYEQNQAKLKTCWSTAFFSR